MVLLVHLLRLRLRLVIRLPSLLLQMYLLIHLCRILFGLIDMDASKDCLSYAIPSRVICKYFISGRPNEVYIMPFSKLSTFDDWRYRLENRNKVVVSLHIKYKYDEDFLSEDGRILK